MAYKITSQCVACGACQEGCPNSAIIEAQPIYIIDYDKCTECVGYYDEQQCAQTCLFQACIPDPDHP